MNLIKLLLIVLNSWYVSTQTEPKTARNVNPSEYRQRVRPEKTQFRQLEDFLTESVNNFKLEFHRSFEESRIKRKQRDSFLFSLPEKGGNHTKSLFFNFIELSVVLKF